MLCGRSASRASATMSSDMPTSGTLRVMGRSARKGGAGPAIIASGDALTKAAARSDVVFLPSSFSLDDVSPTLKVVEALREAGVSPARIAVVFCRTGGSARQEQQARSIFAMNDIAVLGPCQPFQRRFLLLRLTRYLGHDCLR